MTDEYFIDSTKKLGEGSTSRVYFGIKEKDGSQYAMKCFKEKSLKEIENMKMFEDKNFIKFYGCLHEFKGYKQVIVMEYCNNGSLHEFSDLHRGLCDNIFLKVLECLSQCLFYLREKQILHRDIKPGNMMVHLDNMGYYHIKLGDFGSAKEVKDNDTFNTLVGTEEYLHPDMYMYFLKGFSNEFRANVDLWSTGVTLYHVVTTTLPFIPFMYSRNNDVAKLSLKNMYINKKSGIISGIQNTAREDDITWSSKLPSNCRLSPMLTDIASKIIGDLMDLNGSYTYVKFHDDTEDLLKKKRMLFFNSRSGELQILYLDNLTYENVMTEICELTGFTKEETIILTKSRQLDTIKGAEGLNLRSIPIKGHFKYTVTDDTVFVIPINLITEFCPIVSPEPINIKFDSPSVESISFKDAIKYIDNLMKNIYQVSYISDYIDCQIDSYIQTACSFNQHVLIENLRMMNESLPWQIKDINDLCIFTENLLNILDNTDKNEDVKGYRTCRDDIKRMRTKVEKGENCFTQYHNKIVLKNEMMKYTEDNFYSSNIADSNDNLDNLIRLAEELVNEVKLLPEEKLSQSEIFYKLEIWQRQIHLLNIFELTKEKVVAKSKRVHFVHKAFYKWLKPANTAMKRINDLRDLFYRQEIKTSLLRTTNKEIYDCLIKIQASRHEEMVKNSIQ